MSIESQAHGISLLMTTATNNRGCPRDVRDRFRFDFQRVRGDKIAVTAGAVLGESGKTQDRMTYHGTNSEAVTFLR